VEITDNGKGIEQAMLVHPESLGIMSMQERARILGGKIVITSDHGKGTCIVLTAPINNEDRSSLAKAAIVEGD
jgi:two-component system, NarL family, sensor histidine kinase UhpB